MARVRVINEQSTFAAVAAVTVALGIALMGWPSTISVSLLVLPLLAGGYFLEPASLRVVTTLVVTFLVGSAFVRELDGEYWGAVVVVIVTAMIAYGLARSRARLGVHGTMGESMLVDLRDRLAAHGSMPPVPSGWDVQKAQRSGGRTSFSGDFVVFARSYDGTTLEIAVVDVSGKGHEAGTRALQLSGAFGGLLGLVPPSEFLPAANAYLLRQRWPEGFATAVHLVVNFVTGQYTVRSAGHPPAIQYHAGSGRWETLEPTGGLLGVIEKDAYEPVRGTLLRGDAMLLYTDGVVEAPRRDLADGIDKLQGEAERLIVRGGLRRGAEKLIDAVASSDVDDRALVLLWRV